jgi:hypothetical protein
MKKIEKNTEKWWKKVQKTMNNDDQERKNKKHWWKRVKKTMKHDEKEKTKKQCKMMKKRETKTMKTD